MITMGQPVAPSANANTTKTIHFPASRLDEFMAKLNEQFPNLVEGEKPPYTSLYASQSDPKGNITAWLKKGQYTVSVTGALTSLDF